MARVWFDEFTQLATIGDAASPAAHRLQAGDILLHHRHSGDDGWPTGPINPFYCSTAQASGWPACTTRCRPRALG